MSGANAAGGSAPAAGTGVALSALPLVSGATGVPHTGQNRNPGSIGLPQLVQPWTTRVPQAWQNCFPGINSVWHATQRTTGRLP
jgi:ABC-type arginine transport system permease subunit